VNLKTSAAEHMGKITQLENEVKKVKAKLQNSRTANQSARVPPSMDVCVWACVWLWVSVCVCMCVQGCCRTLA
jgi:hypothetical protein